MKPAPTRDHQMPKQRTVKDPAEVKGVGLQTGVPVVLRVLSAPANSGITFTRTDLADKPQINIQTMDLEDSQSAHRRTTVGMGPLQIQTTEHLLAALAGLSIDNIVVELDNVELPGLDGSAKGFADLIRRAGIIEQDAEKKFLKVSEPVWVRDGEAFIAVFPDDNFKVSYTLSYEVPGLGSQYMSQVVNETAFENNIAPARTFCLEQEAEQLLRMGLGKGANYDNTVVIGKDGPIKTSLRFPNEPVRHKVLDLIGDLYLVGKPVIGHVVAIKSGHKLNMELVKKLKQMI